MKPRHGMLTLDKAADPFATSTVAVAAFDSVTDRERRRGSERL